MRTGYAVAIATGILVWTALGFGVVPDDTVLRVLAWLALVPIVLYVIQLVLVYVHELGHLIVGSACGFEPLYFLVGPAMVDMGGDRLRLTLNPMRRHFGGAVIFLPPVVPADQLAARWRWMALAGPAASLLFGLVLIGLARSAILAGQPATTAATVGILSLGAGLANTLPIRRFGLSDGAIYAALARGGEPAERMVRGLRFSRWVMSPVRPAEWPAALIAEAEAVVADWPTDRPIDETDERPGAAQLLFYHYADSGRFDRLGELLDQIATAPRSGRQRRFGTLSAFDVYAALHLAAWERDPVRARALLERVPEKATVRVNSFWHTAWAAVHLAEGSRDRAVREARQALRLLHRFGLRSGGDQAEQRWIETILGQAATNVAAQSDQAGRAMA